MDKFLSNLTDWSKLTPRILLALTIICAAFIFGGSKFFKTLGLDLIQTQYRSYFGLGFLLFGALLISFPVAEGFKWFSGWLHNIYGQEKKKKHYREWFKHLTPSQKIILRSFIENDTRSLSLDYTDGTVTELMNAGIIYLPTSISFFDRYSRSELNTAFNMQPWVFKYLKDHQEILNN